MKKIMIVFGTRPEFIKMFCLIKKFKNSKEFQTIVVSTGQHKEMLKDLYELFEIYPDYNLNIMKKNQTLTDLSLKIFQGINDILQKEKPDLVIIQGDTTSAMVTSLVCFYNRIKVAHIEAGLRTGIKMFPYPEEINRKIISEIADFHFAPTIRAFNNLKNYTGIKTLTGNTVIDAVKWIKKKLNLKNSYQDKVLITIHRRESFGEPIENICKAIKILSKKNIKTQFIFPVHPNPNIKSVVFKILDRCKNIILIKPLRYDKLIKLISQVKYIMTDSGGIQEEACIFNKHVFILRNETERIEGIDAGIATIAGTKTNSIVKLVNNFIPKKNYVNPYGDGKATKRIFKVIKKYYK